MVGWPTLSWHSTPAGAPPLSLRSLQEQGGVFDFPKSDRRAEWGSKSPPCRKKRDKDGAPSTTQYEVGRLGQPPRGRRLTSALPSPLKIS